MKIEKIQAREILDSRGNPTVEVKVTLKNGISAKASVPSGASTGIHEAWELRDNNKKRYGGKGVLKAVKNVNTSLARKLKGKDVRKLREIDETMIELDGTPNKKKLGANALLGVSLACAHTASTASKQPLYTFIRNTYSIREKDYKLPLPMMNIVNGGKHADNTLSAQEFMIVPKASTFAKRLQIGTEVFHTLKDVLHKHNQQTLVGDEGGYAPNVEFLAKKKSAAQEEDEYAFKLIMTAIKEAGYTPGKHVFLAMDVAASEFYIKGKGYDFDFKQKNAGKRIKDFAATQKLYASWIKKYPLISIEDPFEQDRWAEWAEFTKNYGTSVQIVGDDLFVTNRDRLQRGIDSQVANAILIKLNQIGTLTETIDCITHAKNHNYKVIISHRSGETADTTIADLAVATNAEYIKTGSLSRSERVEKYNRLTEIEQEL